MDLQGSLSETLKDETLVAFVRDFMQSARDIRSEVLWTWTADGEIVRTVGNEDSVASPELRDQLVLAEIHLHRIVNPHADGRTSAFLHLSDIGASFASKMRVFGTYFVLVDVPKTPYLVATKFKPKALVGFMNGDSSPIQRVHEAIERTHASPKRFTSEVLGAANIAEMKVGFETLLPDLDFAVVRPSKRGQFTLLV